jgi:hypothetical protein
MIIVSCTNNKSNIDCNGFIKSAIISFYSDNHFDQRVKSNISFNVYINNPNDDTINLFFPTVGYPLSFSTTYLIHNNGDTLGGLINSLPSEEISFIPIVPSDTLIVVLQWLYFDDYKYSIGDIVNKYDFLYNQGYSMVYYYSKNEVPSSKGEVKLDINQCTGIYFDFANDYHLSYRYNDINITPEDSIKYFYRNIIPVFNDGIDIE